MQNIDPVLAAVFKQHAPHLETRYVELDVEIEARDRALVENIATIYGLSNANRDLVSIIHTLSRENAEVRKELRQQIAINQQLRKVQS